MDKYFKPIVVLSIISIIAGLVLSYVYQITREPAEKVKAEQTMKAMTTVLSDAKTFETEEINADGITSFSIGSNDSGQVGYVVEVSSIGYGGASAPIGILVGVDLEGVITGVDILSHNETPGLGANADNDDFKGQYIGKSGEFVVVKTGSTNDNEIDAMAGATITSNAVTSGINNGVNFLKEKGVIE